MSRIKEIARKTFIARLLREHPKMGIGLSFVVIIYVFIHFFRLEVYPLYTFAMYSKKEPPKTEYHTYSIVKGAHEMDLSYLDYRKYTVLMNTISQYDGIIHNDLTHPESIAIDKFINRLKLNKTGIENFLKKSHRYDENQLKSIFGNWLAKEFNAETNNFSINKNHYTWSDSSPQLFQTTSIYESAR